MAARKKTASRGFVNNIILESLISGDKYGYEIISEIESASETETQESTEQPTEPEAITPTKRVAFTFDDGPTPGVTEKILDKLEELGGRATFFQVANRHNYIENAT